MSSNLDKIYSDVFSLKDPGQYSSVENNERDFTLSPSKLVSNLSGLFKVEDNSLYLISEDSFYSCKIDLNKFSSKPFSVSSTFKIPPQAKDFLVESGRVFILYQRKILVFNLQQKKVLFECESKSELFSIISLRGQVFTFSGFNVYQVQERFLYVFFSAPKPILEIKASFYNSNCILIVMDHDYLIVDDKTDVQFQYSTENPSDVDFFNEDHLVFYDKYKNQLYFIDWADSNAPTAQIDLNAFDILEMKVKENLAVLVDKDLGLMVCVVFDVDRNEFRSFSGIIENSFEGLDFSSNEFDSQFSFGQFDGFSNLNFVLARENNLYCFSLKINLEEKAAICFTVRFLSTGLNGDQQVVRVDQPKPIEPCSVFRLKPENIPNKELIFRKEPEKLNLVNKNSQQYEGLLQMRELFTNEKIQEMLRKAFDLVLPLEPKRQLKVESLIDLREIQYIKNAMNDINSRI